MKYKICSNSNKKRGFTILESVVYIFLITLILAEGISLFVSMYKSYIETRNMSIKYNNMQNFYVNLDKISSEGNIQEIIVGNNYILFSKDANSNELNKTIKSNDGSIVVKYTKGTTTETINTILTDIGELKVKKKGNLIYLIISDKDGKEFIRCI